MRGELSSQEEPSPNAGGNQSHSVSAPVISLPNGGGAIRGASHFLSFYSVKHTCETFLISPPKRLGICVNWSDWLTCASTGYEFLLS